MTSKNSVNNADNAIQHQINENELLNHEIKEKFMQHKSKDVLFFNEEMQFPAFSLLSERENGENFHNLNDFPKKGSCLFDEINDNSYDFPSRRDKAKIAHSYLFSK